MTHPADYDALLPLIGEPIQAYPNIWTLQEWWEWHERLTRAVTRPIPPEVG